VPELSGFVDLFTPLINDVHAPLPLGTRAFWYQSCMSHGCDIVGGPEFTRWPTYVIDAPTGIAHRIEEWLSFRYRVTGELYYNSVERYNVGDPWESTRMHGGNGDGTLFYPGAPARVAGRTDIPIESIRLKLIRDGEEDYEYLLLAPPEVARAEAARIARGPREWSHDAAALAAARHRLAAAISSAVTRGVDAPRRPQPAP
jgi:hypothetical protein